MRRRNEGIGNACAVIVSAGISVEISESQKLVDLYCPGCGFRFRVRSSSCSAVRRCIRPRCARQLQLESIRTSDLRFTSRIVFQAWHWRWAQPGERFGLFTRLPLQTIGYWTPTRPRRIDAHRPYKSWVMLSTVRLLRNATDTFRFLRPRRRSLHSFPRRTPGPPRC
jgi:hypothetical protein